MTFLGCDKYQDPENQFWQGFLQHYQIENQRNGEYPNSIK